MQFNNPIPRTGMPRFHESSSQRSARDSDAIGKGWLKSRTISAQVQQLSNNMSQVQRQLIKLKRRILGGTGGGGGMNLASPRAYDKTSSYEGGDSKRDVVIVLEGDPLITSGATDPDTLQTVYTVAGVWVCLKNASPVPDEENPGEFLYHIPQWPYPTPNSPDAENNYWWLISPANVTC